MSESLRAFRLCVAAVAWAAIFVVPRAGAEPTTYWQQIESAGLETGKAFAVENLKLKAGLAEFHIEDGVVFPATPVAGRPVELVFIGVARLRLEAPDDIEAGQLELFTEKTSLDERITEAVLAITLDAASDAITTRPSADDSTAATAARAGELFEQWKQRPERRLLGVEEGIFRDAVGDPLYRGFFAGWFRGEELGEFLYLVEPDAAEQVTLGQFQLLEASEKERRKINRQIHRAQRRGRLIGLELDDLGQWDTWVSSSMRNADGEPRAGFQSFEPDHYRLDVSFGDRLELSGKARLELRTVAKPARVVKLEIHPDLLVERATVEGFEGDLFFRQSRDSILVLMPESLAHADQVALEIEYSGKLIEKADWRTWVLLDTIRWHPHAGQTDLATYDVTFEWPDKFELLSAGHEVDSGEKKDRLWRRVQLDKPTLGFGFEIGKFHTLTSRVGHVDITLALDGTAYSTLEKDSRKELLASVGDALLYFEEIFGPYPLDTLTVVTSPRGFSQSLLGFITMSTLSVLDTSWFSLYFGIEDRRTVIAHELAHQWWGHMVAWQSYRDQWISEAMANYAAVLYARNRLPGGAARAIGPTTGWQQALTAMTEDGRPIESTGPLVLGERLVSSRTFSAYQAIVYKKGAVVLDMLARRFGEENFVRILRNLAQAVAFRPVSTQILIDLIERSSTVDLDGFARQFIYGTGLPVVSYSYDFVPGEEGLWTVTATARQQSPYRYNYRVVDRGDGVLDVARERLEQIEVADSNLVVPVQIAVYDPSAPVSKTMKKRRLDPKEIGNAFLHTHMLLEGETSQLEVKVAYEPKRVFLDREKEVFGRFFDDLGDLKRRSFSAGLEQMAAKNLAAAETSFREAIAAAPARATPDEEIDEDDVRLLDGRIYLELGRLYLDQGRVDDARQAFEEVDDRINRETRFYLEPILEILEARLAILQRDHDRAYRLLRDLRRGKVESTEGQLLLAIATRANGRRDEHDAAVAAATLKGADVSVLEVGSTASASSERR